MKLTLVSDDSELLEQWDLKEELCPDTEPGTYTGASWWSLVLAMAEEAKKAHYNQID